MNYYYNRKWGILGKKSRFHHPKCNHVLSIIPCEFKQGAVTVEPVGRGFICEQKFFIEVYLLLYYSYNRKWAILGKYSPY